MSKQAKKRHKKARLGGRVTAKPSRGWAPAGWHGIVAAVPGVAGPGAVPGVDFGAVPVSGATTPTTPKPAVTPTPTPAGPDVPDLPTSDPRSVSVRSTEFAFSLSQTHVKAGRVRVQFDNSRAMDPHSLIGRGSPIVIGETQPRQTVAQSFDLTPGTYVLYCPILDHEAQGMKATLVVDP